VRRLAIIPARGGSKRIPNKNIKSFYGKPMIYYSLNAAKLSGLFDKIHVSTDSDEIAKVVTKLGFEIDFLRDASLADDLTPIMPVLKWVLEKYESQNIIFDEVALIMACAPLIDFKDLQEASKLMKINKSLNPVMAISSYSVPIEWAFRKDKASNLIPVNPGKFKIRSQDLEKKYFDAGLFTFFPKDTVLNSKGAGDDKSYIGYELNKIQAIDIDDQEDWDFAELVMQVISKN